MFSHYLTAILLDLLIYFKTFFCILITDLKVRLIIRKLSQLHLHYTGRNQKPYIPQKPQLDPYELCQCYHRLTNLKRLNANQKSLSLTRQRHSQCQARHDKTLVTVAVLPDIFAEKMQEASNEPLRVWRNSLLSEKEAISLDILMIYETSLPSCQKRYYVHVWCKIKLLQPEEWRMLTTPL